MFFAFSKLATVWVNLLPFNKQRPTLLKVLDGLFTGLHACLSVRELVRAKKQTF